MIEEQNTRILTAGCYRLDDLRQGDVIETPAHLVLEDDITEFAKLSGDYFAIHMDKQAAIDAVLLDALLMGYWFYRSLMVLRTGLRPS